MRLIPPADYIDSQSNAELRVAQILEDIPGGRGTAYHSVHLPRHRRQIMGEADFVVLWNGAILVLEVKGGRIGRTEQGRWFSKDRYGKDHSLGKSPWDQARDASFALLDLLKENTPKAQYWPFAYAVVTPDQSLPSDLERLPQQHIGIERMSVRGMEEALDALNRLARAPRNGKDQGLRPPADLSDVERYLRPKLDAMRTLRDTEHLIDREIVTMTDAQIDAMRAVERNERVLVLGGAGTGKTVLAVEAARRAASDGSSVAFVCSSPGVLALAGELLKGSPVEVVRYESIPEDPSFDVVVVDEAQDLLNILDMSRLSAALREGLDGGRWWLYLDPNNQAHLIGRFDESTFREVQSSAVTVDLSKNVRNSRAVVTTVQSHLGADLGVPGIGEGTDASVVKAATPEEAGILLEKRIRVLLDREVARKDITIITAATDPSTSILAQDGRVPAEYRVDGRKYEVTTAAEIKGLERAHVIVVDVADLESPGNRAACYVAMTRPRYSLYVIGSPSAYQVMGGNALEFIRQQAKKGEAHHD